MSKEKSWLWWRITYKCTRVCRACSQKSNCFCMYNSTYIQFRGFTKFGIKVLWRLQFFIGYRTLSLKSQKARTKIEVVLSLHRCICIRGFTKFGIKVLWRLLFFCRLQDLKFKISAGSDQNWSCPEPSKILNLRSCSL